MLSWILTPFKNEKIGRVGTCQRVKRVETGNLIEEGFNWLGAAYIKRRNFEILVMYNINGGMLYMSRRTCAF
jgi:hypothetical protein